MFDDLFHGEIDFLLRGEATQTEADARVRQVFLHSDGAQDVGGLQGGGGTGAGGRQKIDNTLPDSLVRDFVFRRQLPNVSQIYR